MVSAGDVSQGCTAKDEAAAALRTCARVGVAYAQDPQQKDRSAATDFVERGRASIFFIGLDIKLVEPSRIRRRISPVISSLAAQYPGS